MSIKVSGEAEIVQEAQEILLQHLSPAKAARFWANWQMGRGNYLAWRDQQFAGETVDTLYQQILEFQQSGSTSA